MKTFLQNLAWERADDSDGVFVATPRYYSPMDFLLYLTEDLSYRADRVDESLTVLWHPHEERLIGIKLKGFSVLFRQVKETLELNESEYVSLVTMVTEAALSQSTAQKILDGQQAERQKNMRRKYLLAVDFVRKAPAIQQRELKLAA